MSLLKSYIQDYTSLNPKEQKTVIGDILLLSKPIAGLFEILENSENEHSLRRQAINVLCDIAQKPSYAKCIFKFYTPDYAKTTLNYDDPKIRKAAARLCGIANKKEYNESLIMAIQNEQTMYVLDSLILALGYTDYSKRSLDFLKAYQPKSSEKKHLEKEISAIKKAISSLTKTEKIQSVELCQKKVVLTYCGELKDALSSELNHYELNYQPTDIIKNSLMVAPKNYSDVFGLRCFFEALILVGEYQSITDEELSKILVDNIQMVFDNSHYSFRLDVQYLNPEAKKNKITNLVSLLEKQSGFFSSTSNYQFEIRLLYRKDQVIVFFKVPNMDTRFSYRKHTIPASIHPVIASSMIRTIVPYLTKDATVIDPFCGTGTLLYERDIIMPCEELVGVDIKKETLDMAKDNFSNVDIPIAFLNANILNSHLNQQFDEIICNMPFGRRVANHDKNEKLYAEFVKMLTQLLKNNGYAFLYTNEKNLLRDEIRKYSNLNLIDEIIIEAGGLFPSLFIIKNSI